MKFRDFKIKWKIISIFALILLCIIALSTYLFSDLSELKSMQDEGFQRALDASNITQCSMMHEKLYTVFADAIINKNLDENKIEWEKMYSELNKDLDGIDAIIDNKDEKQLIQDARNYSAEYNNIYLAVFEKLKHSKDTTGIEALDVKADGIRAQYKIPLEKVMNSLKTKMTDSDNQFDAKVKKAKSSLFILGLITMIIGLIATIILVRTIVYPLVKGLSFVEKIASGDLSVELNTNQKDEVGQLASAMNRMRVKLRDIIENIRQGAENIASASLQMSSTSQEMSQGATEQASSAEEISSSMEEMASNIQQNTDNAQQTEKISNGAVEGVAKVSEASKESLNSVKEIASKISIINDIAFQTNILALNAAVEAARAGEHGRGFAVVASEVRKLAERSKIAADEIGILSASSVKVTEEAGNLMMKIIPDIDKTSKLLQEITAASKEQNSGAEQVNSAIQQLNNVTQQNAAASEEMATSAEELSSQADQLKELIAYFSFGNNQESKKAAIIRHKTIKTAGLHKPDLKNNRPALKEVKSKGIQLNLVETSDSEFERM